MQLFSYLSPAVSDASAKTKHHSFQHLISGKFGTLGDGWPWSFMEKMSNWQEVCKLRWQTALIVPQPKWVLCTCWVCLEPHFLPETMSWPATLDTPHISHDLLWIFWIYIVLTGEVFQPPPGPSELEASSFPSVFVGSWLTFSRYSFICSLLEFRNLPCQGQEGVFEVVEPFARVLSSCPCLLSW